MGAAVSFSSMAGVTSTGGRAVGEEVMAVSEGPSSSSSDAVGAAVTPSGEMGL
jgi:hypothetical protein